MFGVLDTVSDVIFAVTLTMLHVDDSDEVPLLVSVLAWVCIVCPILLSLFQLVRKSRGDWAKYDNVSRWIFKFSFFLYFLPIFSGSAFVALALVNSNALQLNVFSMGLSKHELSMFNVQRVWSIVMLENLPQLGLQIWFN